MIHGVGAKLSSTNLGADHGRLRMLSLRPLAAWMLDAAGCGKSGCDSLRDHHALVADFFGGNGKNMARTLDCI